MATHSDTVRDWLKALGALTAAVMTNNEAKARVSAIATLLANEFPTAAFCPASLAHVARECRHFPTYAELCDLLGPWWKQHRPEPTMIETDTWQERQQRAEDERAGSWILITDTEIREKIRNLNGHPLRSYLGRLLATCIARHAPKKLGLLPPEFLKHLDA